MPRLLVQADDNGISRGVVLGILDSINFGIVRNTGLFSNAPHASLAAAQLRDRADVAVGLDLNFVTGHPLSSSHAIPSMVGPSGQFHTSHEVLAATPAHHTQGWITVFEVDPYPLAEVQLEADAQVQRFIELAGRKPDYLHVHSLVTPNTDQVIRGLATSLGVPYSSDVLAANGIAEMWPDWYQRPFPLAVQAGADAESAAIAALQAVGDDATVRLIAHPGYVDAELLDASSFSVIRARDLQMTCSARLRDLLDGRGFELITYRDI